MAHDDLPSSPTCAKCGYDLTGTPSLVCPECGTVPTINARFHAERRAFKRSWLWLGLAFLPPLTWIALVNVHYVCGRLATGEWPGRWNNPDPTPFLGLCHLVLSYVLMVMPILMSILPGIAWLRHARATEMLGSPSKTTGEQLSMLVWGWIGGLGACWLLLWLDPLGAFSWFVD